MLPDASQNVAACLSGNVNTHRVSALELAVLKYLYMCARLVTTALPPGRGPKIHKGP